MLGKAGSLEGARHRQGGEPGGRGCPLLGGLELPVGGLGVGGLGLSRGGLGVASWWPGDLEFFTNNFLVTLLQIFCMGKI